MLLTLQEVLLIDIGFGQWLAGSVSEDTTPAWHQVTRASFKSNDISYIDESVVRTSCQNYNKAHHTSIDLPPHLLYYYFMQF